MPAQILYGSCAGISFMQLCGGKGPLVQRELAADRLTEGLFTAVLIEHLLDKLEFSYPAHL